LSNENPAAGVDMHRLLIEIDEEVRAKRASGEIPSELERELDMVFARFAPAGAVEGDFDQLLERAESQAFFDLIAPNESVRPGVPHAKRVIQKSVRWYMRYVIEQVTGFAQTIAKATRQLNERVKIVERQVAPAEEFAALRRDGGHLSTWQDGVVASLKDVRGRVLHARCGTGELVGALRSAGVDAYGVDPAAELVALGTAGTSGLDLRPDSELEHLSVLAPGSLDGLVLTGCVDTLPRGSQVELVDRAAVTLATGATLVIVAAHPDAWARSGSALERDLAPGRPMQSETWKYLLEERGFSQVTIEHDEPGQKLDASADASMQRNIELLNSVLFPPQSSLIIAKR
jgi:hypothetical protein